MTSTGRTLGDYFDLQRGTTYKSRLLGGVTGSRQGRVVLVEHRDILDPDFGGNATVKIWDSDKVLSEDGTWRHEEVRLKPDSHEPNYEPIVLRDVGENEVRVVAELRRGAHPFATLTVGSSRRCASTTTRWRWRARSSGRP